MRAYSNSAPGWSTWRNSHLQGPLWLFKAVITDTDYDALLSGNNKSRRSVARRLAQRALWFWPRIDDAAGWAEAEMGGHWSPDLYLRQNPTRPAQRVINVIPRSETLMELACNSGCDLNFVHQAGFTQVKGVDVSGQALVTFQEVFPEAWASAEISHDLFQRYLLNQPSKSVDTIYSNGCAIELVHPSFPIVREICRVARGNVILELDPYISGYTRDYVGQFRKRGFTIAYSTEAADGPGVSHLYHFVAG